MNSSKSNENLTSTSSCGDSGQRSMPVYLIHYDAADWLQSACKSIARGDASVELTVINNSASPLELEPTIRVLQMQRNDGFTAAANAALRDWMSGSARYCVIGSHDLHLGQDALGLMRIAMEANPSIGIAGPRLRHDNEMPTALPGLEEVDWISGTCMMLRRECLREVGLFDERYKSYAEDFDICARARQQGWTVMVVREATAHGLGTAHAGQSPRRMANSVLYDVKNYGYRAGVRTLVQIARRIPAAIRRRRWRDMAAPAAALPIGVWHLVTYRRNHPAARNPWTHAHNNST